MSFKPNGSPPPDNFEQGDHENNVELQHFYCWMSPPGIIKIMCVLSVIWCVKIFMCSSNSGWVWNLWNHVGRWLWRFLKLFWWIWRLWRFLRWLWRNNRLWNGRLWKLWLRYPQIAD